jgi:hypothetical protein
MGPVTPIDEGSRSEVGGLGEKSAATVGMVAEVGRKLFKDGARSQLTN